MMKRLFLSAFLGLLSLSAVASDCIPSGVTDQYTYFVAVDSTDFTTRVTGLSSFAVYRSRDGGAATAFTTPTVNETDATNMPGVYELLLDEDMTIGSGNDVEHMAVHITATGMAPVTKEFCIARSKITAGETLALSSGVLGTGVINANTLATDTITAAKIAADSIGASEIATNAIGAAEIADDAVGAAEAGFLTDSTGFAGADIASILTDTGTTLDAALAVVGSNVDAILVDTGTTLDAALAVVDSNVDNLVLEQFVTTIATLSTQTSFTLTAGSADANAYNGWEIIVIDQSTNAQRAVGVVQDYAVTTRTVTLMVDPGVFTMAVGDTVVLRPANANVRQINCYEATGNGTSGTLWAGTSDGGC